MSNTKPYSVLTHQLWIVGQAVSTCCRNWSLEWITSWISASPDWQACAYQSSKRGRSRTYRLTSSNLSQRPQSLFNVLTLRRRVLKNSRMNVTKFKMSSKLASKTSKHASLKYCHASTKSKAKHSNNTSSRTHSPHSSLSCRSPTASTSTNFCRL